MKIYRKWLIYTLLLILVLSSFFLYRSAKGPFSHPYPFYKGSYGNVKAPIQITIFQEFACPQCKRFHTEDLPKIDHHYVKKGQVGITVVPLAFLKYSIPSCLASLCIQKLLPHEAKDFYSFLFELPQEKLLSFSAESLIHLYSQKKPKDFPKNHLCKCLQKPLLNLIEYNLSLAKHIYTEDQIHVPIVLINEHLILQPDYATVSKVIDEML